MTTQEQLIRANRAKSALAALQSVQVRPPSVLCCQR